MQKVFIFPYFYPNNSQKGIWIGIYRPNAQNIQNFCIIKTTNAIPTKFCTVINTTKLPLWVIPKFAPQIQNGGRLPSWKRDKLLYLWNFACWQILALQTLNAVQKFNFLKIQDGGRPPYWKTLNVISPQPFGQFLLHFAWWHILVIQSLPPVQKSNF